MVEKNREIKLTNRDSGKIGYTIPDTGLHRDFIAGETKTVTFDEIEKLSWTAGGRVLLHDYLIIQDPEAAQEILGDIEPEYYYDKDTVKTLLTEGTLEQLQDTLEFAPKGVIDLVKEEAVNLPLNNVAMRKEILNQTNFNVDRAVAIKEASQLEDDSTSNAATSQRRATPIAATSQKKDDSRKSTPIIIKR